MILRGGRLSERVPYLDGALANYEMGHGLHVEERAKRNLWENPSGGSFLIENLNVQGQRDAALVNCRSRNMSRAQ